MQSLYVYCAEWVENGEKQKSWYVPNPEDFKRQLIARGIPKEDIDIYEKDVS